MESTPPAGPRRRLPTRGPGRRAALSALEAVVVADTIQTLNQMTREGGSADAALESYRSWFLNLLSSAIDEGFGDWTWRGPS